MCPVFHSLIHGPWMNGVCAWCLIWHLVLRGASPLKYFKLKPKNTHTTLAFELLNSYDLCICPALRFPPSTPASQSNHHWWRDGTCIRRRLTLVGNGRPYCRKTLKFRILLNDLYVISATGLVSAEPTLFVRRSLSLLSLFPPLFLPSYFASSIIVSPVLVCTRSGSQKCVICGRGANEVTTAARRRTLRTEKHEAR